ncbi:phosphatidylcholine:diacylglycerol cholinephosphotransferase 1-like [Iris pallida]|uniref:Phosphatidylcholine:diacylglycerol cholinephosphotransferase 1-like n=1 Tax=Iris pallida TaxID=29817 RepID=A0AAX6EU49_IRIPA|nr:phosphatidylcholine:diacylglycerol cholinephosphotransferase 1-like [Iris pallida]
MIRVKFKTKSNVDRSAADEGDDTYPSRDSYCARYYSLLLTSLASSFASTSGSSATAAMAVPADRDTSVSKKTEPLLPPVPFVPPKGPAFSVYSVGDVAGLARRHPVPCALTLSLLFFMGVEYTLRMVPASSQPVDVGFVHTRTLHRALAARPDLNSALAALNTVFVGMQIAYILWNFLVEGRPRSTVAALFMFTCRGILGYSTQLPLPEGFLGSGVDFPVGNVSFFLFFSGHVGGSVIATQDMRRMRRHSLAWTFDVLNMLQMLRLLATRGHYTIDLAAGLGAGFLSDILAGKYEEWKKYRTWQL